MMKRITLVVCVISCWVSQALAEPLTLPDAFEKALAKNPSIAAVAERVNQARERVVQARAGYFPQLDFSTAAARKQLSRNENETSGLSRNYETYEGFFTASWVLFSGFSRQYELKAAEIDRDREIQEHADTIRTLLAAVAASFHTAQLALANQFIAESNRDFYATQLETARIKQKAGVGSLSDVLNFNTRMNQAGIEVAKYQTDYDVARAALAALLGEDAGKGELPEPVFPKPEDAADMSVPDPAVEIDAALSLRPDLRRQALAVDSARAEAGAARASFYPEISLSGSIGADRTNSAGFGSDDIENTLGIELSYPLFDGGEDRAALREALSDAVEAEMTLKNLKNEIISQVRQDCFSVASAQEQLHLYRENAVLARQNRDMVAKAYEYGTANLVTLNEVQNTLTETRQRIALSLITLRQARFELQASTGTIYEGKVTAKFK
ncbi:MAG TPA: hypothetical protein DHV36_02980 [Desulfobacteraceae bacterium]|nr:hypothetical protein [Desulfobacteraceae bacterium]